MFKRSWIRILEPYTGWTFFTLICCIVCLKRPKINEKEAGICPFLYKKNFVLFPSPYLQQQKTNFLKSFIKFAPGSKMI